MNQELRVDLPNGSRVQLYGTDNPDSLQAYIWTAAVLDEYTLNPPFICYLKLSPSFIGPPRVAGHYRNPKDGIILGLAPIRRKQPRMDGEHFQGQELELFQTRNCDSAGD